MKLNSKWGKNAEEFKRLSFKQAKTFIKQDLKRLEQYSSVDNPMPVAILGTDGFVDKATEVAVLLMGQWKGDFKKYIKEELIKEPLGAIGQIYMGETGEDGQKNIHIDLAKGKGKARVDKLAKGLNKIIPQSTYNILFGEISETAMDQLESNWEQRPEPEEPNDETPLADAGEVDATGMDVQKLLDSNIQELSKALKTITTEVQPRIQTRSLQENDLDLLVDTLDLANEWMEIWEETQDKAVKENSKNLEYLSKVTNIAERVKPMLQFVKAFQHAQQQWRQMDTLTTEINQLLSVF